VKPTTLADRLEQVIGMDGLPRSLRSAIERELIHYFGLPPIRALERAETAEAAVSRVIAKRAAHCERNGTSPILTLVGTNSDIVAGSCHVLPIDAAQVSSIKLQRIFAGSIHSAMRALSFSDFEKFGSRVLSEIGAKDSFVTPHGGDQGIDFFGMFSVGQLHNVPSPFLKLAHDVLVSFAGQAKHYPNRSVGPDVVRELIGAVSLARTKTFSKPGLDMFHDLTLKPFSPLVTLLFTTGEITSGAAELADSAGIIARSGEQLAVFLADRGVGVVHTEQGATFSLEAFTRWLGS